VVLDGNEFHSAEDGSGIAEPSPFRGVTAGAAVRCGGCTRALRYSTATKGWALIGRGCPNRQGLAQMRSKGTRDEPLRCTFPVYWHDTPSPLR
jgi:hypothetical protein